MYGLVVPDPATGEYVLATWSGAVIVGTRDQVLPWRGMSVRLPDGLGPWVTLADIMAGHGGTVPAGRFGEVALQRRPEIRNQDIRSQGR